MMGRKYKCRPAEECYWGDEYYTKEVEVSAYAIRPEFEAAQEFAAFHCNRRAEYGEMEVQVLLADGWYTFEVGIVSVPEFVAQRKKGAEVVPDTFRCNECDVRKPMAERSENKFTDECMACVGKMTTEMEGDE